MQIRTQRAGPPAPSASDRMDDGKGGSPSAKTRGLASRCSAPSTAIRKRKCRKRFKRSRLSGTWAVYIAPTKMTVKQWLEIWLDEYTGGVKSSTRVSYRQHAQNHIIPALGAVKLSALKPRRCRSSTTACSVGRSRFLPRRSRISTACFTRRSNRPSGWATSPQIRRRPVLFRESKRRRSCPWTRRRSRPSPRCPGRQRVFHAPESRPVHGNAGGGNSGPAMGLRGL